MTNSHVNGVCFQFMDIVILFMDNGYKIPNFRAHGQVCQTNLPTFTSFRGFGSPEGQFVMQTVLQHIADALKLPPHQVCGMCIVNITFFTMICIVNN